MARDERTKADYQPWNHEHFMADMFVRRMKPSIRKSYVMLLHECFFCTTRPYLPDDDNRLWLMADCETKEEWLSQSEALREMFEPIEIDGVKLLVQKRVEEDWNRILDKRGVVSESRSKAAKARWERKKQTDANECKTEQTDANECKTEQTMLREAKRSKEKLSMSEVEPSEESNPDTGQEEPDMKAWKQIQIASESILGVRAENYAREEVDMLVLANSSGQVVREFIEWAHSNQGDDFYGKPVSMWLRGRSNPSLQESKAAVDDLRVIHIAREVAYRTDGSMTFGPKDKAKIKKALDEGFSVDEILSPQKDFFQKMDTNNAIDMKLCGQNFANVCGDLAFGYRRKKAEKDQEASNVDSARERMQRDAETERLARQKAQESEQAQIEVDLPD